MCEQGLQGELLLGRQRKLQGLSQFLVSSAIWIGLEFGAEFWDYGYGIWFRGFDALLVI